MSPFLGYSKVCPFSKFPCLEVSEHWSASGKAQLLEHLVDEWHSQSYKFVGLRIWREIPQGPERLRSHSLLWTDGVLESQVSEPSSWALVTSVSEGTPLGLRIPQACCPGPHHLSSLGLAALQALTRLGCPPVTLGRDGSGFNNLNTLLPHVETPSPE